MERTIPALLAALLLTAVVKAEDTKDSPIEVAVGKKDDAATIAVNQPGVTVQITSAKGIGSATIRRVDMKWPARLTLQIGVANLEGFSISNDLFRAQTFLKNSGPAEVVPLASTAKEETPKVVTVPIKRLGPKLIEVTVPEALMTRRAEVLRVQWVDFYR